MDEQKTIAAYTGGGVRVLFQGISSPALQGTQEVRLRCDLPLLIRKADKEWFISNAGRLTTLASEAYTVTAQDIAATVEIISDHSLYAFEEELRSGYLTLPGGHRVGVAGRAVVTSGAVRTIKNINSLHIRIAHALPGCAAPLLPFIGGHHTMILSPPGCGKTTLLRDAARLLSNGGLTIGMVDERSELAGCYRGKPQNDVGIRTDVLDGCPKAQGMLMLLRAMSPHTIVVDELGRREELEAIEDILSAGVRLICTAHGHSLDELAKRPVLKEILAKGFIKRFIVLDGKPHAGHVAGIFDENGRRLDTGGRGHGGLV